MKKLKKMEWIMGLLIAVLFLSGCFSDPADFNPASLQPSPDNLIVVGYVQVGSESDWRIANTRSFKETFTEEHGFDLIFIDGQQKLENQIKALRNLIQQDVDFIVLAPIVESGWDTVLQEVKDAGIPVILSDRMVDVKDPSLYAAWVGGDFVKEGEKAIDWLTAYLKKTDRGDEIINVVELQGTPGASAEIGRTKGVANKLAENPNYHLLAIEPADFTQSRGHEVMQSFLEKYDDIDVVVAQNDNMAFGAIQAIRQAGLVPGRDILVVSFDAVRAALEKITSGEINVSVECNPLHGPLVAEIIRKMRAGEPVERVHYMDEQVFDYKNSIIYLPFRQY